MPGLRLILDEDSSRHSLVRALNARGVDVITVTDAGMLGQSDAVQLAHARAEGRILYSANVADFARLHAISMRAADWHPGIVVRTWQAMPVGEQLRAILSLQERETQASMQNRLVYLEEYRMT